MADATGTVDRVKQAAPDGDAVSVLARAGLVAEGVLYVVIGLLAIELARGDRATDPGTTGAIETVARQPYGQWLLGLLTAGLFAMAAWRTVQAVRGDPVEGDDTSDRVKYAAIAVVYLVLAIGALATLLANVGESSGSGSGAGGSGSGGSRSQQATAVVLDWPGGRWLVGIAGLAVIGAGLYVAWKHAVGGAFEERLRRMSDAVRRAVVALGRAGYGARGVVFAVVGGFLVYAAVTYDASEAKGLSGSLQSVARDDLGRLLLWAIAVGLLCYGAYKLAAARFRRVS